MKVLVRLFVLGFACITSFLNAQVAPVYTDPLNVITSKDPVLIQAIEFLRYGDSEGALKILLKNKTGSENSYESYFLKGIAYRQTGDLTNAIHAFTQSVHEDGFFIPGFFERGNCYLYRQNFGLAVFDYDRVLLLDSTFLPAYNNRAYARIRNYGEQGNPTQQLRFAKEDLNKIIEISSVRGDKPRFEYFFNIGLIDLYSSEYKLASESFSRAIQVDPSISKAYYFRGASLFLAHSYELAAVDFRTSEEMGFVHANTPEFLRIIDLVEQYQQEHKE
ncbi:MAG TPA: tetratricopeptide repeat protein [Flavobacteriales bacterium]|nr:tetratricopeptide repeat protein [Flavobacteriales bacterium]